MYSVQLRGIFCSRFSLQWSWLNLLIYSCKWCVCVLFQMYITINKEIVYISVLYHMYITVNKESVYISVLYQMYININKEIVCISVLY